MPYTFADLATNQELQNIVLQHRIYGKDQTLFEPFEVLFKWVFRKSIKGFSYTWPLKDNVKAIDCIIGNNAIQLKATKHVNEDKELDYLRGEIARQGLQCEAKLIVCNDDFYAKLLAKCDFNTPSVQLRPYQKEFINKHLDGILHHHISIVNCFCRFGKSYLMRYIADVFRWDVSIITTKPTETAGDYAFDNVVSIQYLKLHKNTTLKDIIFIDEPQESFMTDLTEATLNLANFKHVVFFTGTSEKLESYLTEPYYLAHYNFGDYISRPVEGFPKIHFHLGASEEINEGIRLIFDRDLTRVKGRAEATANGWQFQSAADDTDIRVSTEGTYLLISQFTTGATIPNCFIIEDRNKTFTEEDIQLIFRCFNTTEVDTPRHVYFQNVDVYKGALTYLYHQTGKTFINTDIILDFFSGIVSAEDVTRCNFDRLRVQVDKKGAKILQRALTKLTKPTNIQETMAKTHKRIRTAQEGNGKPMTEQEERVKNYVYQAAQTGNVDPNFLIFMERILSALIMQAFQENMDMSHINELNQDIDCVYLWNNIKDITRIKWQFLSFKFVKGQQVRKEGEYMVDILQEIIKIFKTIVKNKFLSNVLELIQTPLSRQKYEEMCELFMTTEIEKKENAEILTPWEVAEEMVNACEECGVLKPGVKCLEPCCGKGVFLTLLLLRGYEVDYSDVSPANVQFCDILTGRSGTVQNALTRDDYAEYDLVITNPPYNEPKKGDSNTQKPIYHLFCQAALQAKASCFLVKSAFGTTFSSKAMMDFRHELIPHLQFKKFYAKDVFADAKVEIQGGVMFYVYNREYENPDKTEFISPHEIQTYEDSILTQFKFIGRPQIASNDKRLVEEQCEGYVPCHMSFERIKYFPKDEVQIDLNSYYLIFPASSYEGGDTRVFSRFIVVKPGECFNFSFSGFKVKDEDEARRLEAHLKKYEGEISKLKSTHNIQRDIFRVVPRME